MNVKTEHRAERSNKVDYYDDEISLAELWLMLSRRRLMILGCVLGALLVAIAAILLTPPQYESRAVISVGRLPDLFQHDQSAGSVPLEDPQVLVQRLRYLYPVKVEAERKVETVLTLTARGPSPKESRATLARVTDELMAEHRSRYEGSNGIRESRLRRLELEIAEMNAQTQRMAEQVAKLSERDPSTAAIVTVERAKLLVDRAALETQAANLRQGLLPPESEPTRLLLEPTVPQDTVRPRPMLYLVIAMVAGIMLGVASALLVEAISNARR